MLIRPYNGTSPSENYYSARVQVLILASSLSNLQCEALQRAHRIAFFSATTSCFCAMKSLQNAAHEADRICSQSVTSCWHGSLSQQSGGLLLMEPN